MNTQQMIEKASINGSKKHVCSTVQYNNNCTISYNCVNIQLGLEQQKFSSLVC